MAFIFTKPQGELNLNIWKIGNLDMYIVYTPKKIKNCRKI